MWLRALNKSRRNELKQNQNKTAATTTITQTPSLNKNKQQQEEPEQMQRNDNPVHIYQAFRKYIEIGLKMDQNDVIPFDNHVECSLFMYNKCYRNHSR